MSMTPVPEADFITQSGDDTPQVASATQWFEDLRNAVAQSLGMSSDGLPLVIAGGVVAPTLGSHTIDTEAEAVADDLTNIDPTGIPDGRIIIIRCFDATRVVTVKHAVAGAGQILMSDGADYALNADRRFLILKLKNNVWEELARALAGDLGTAAKSNTGTISGTVPLLTATGLPAISGAGLTDIPRIGNFAPSQQTSPNMTLKVAAGSVLVGTGLVNIAAQSSGTITAPVAHPRNDIVYIDQATGVIGVAGGTENAVPADPALPLGKLAIARLRMTSGQTSITSADFDDIRSVGSAEVAFVASKNGVDQTGIASGTFTKLSFTNEITDIGGYYDAANSRWTPLPGVYLVIGGARFTAGLVDQQACIVAIYKNGAAAAVSAAIASGTSICAPTIAYIVMANGTDFFELYAVANGAGNKTVAGTEGLTYFQGFRIGN